jgi:hypothetical protein
VDSLDTAIKENPEMEELLSLLIRLDMDFVEAVAAVITPEELQAAADAAADGTELSKRVGDRKAKKAKQAELERNIVESLSAIDKYCEQSGYDEARRLKLADDAIKWFSVWADGKITVAEVAKLDKMASYDEDVSASYDEGKKDGQAQKVMAIKADKNADAVTAGIGRIGTGAGTGMLPKKDAGYDESDDLARAANNIYKGRV